MDKNWTRNKESNQYGNTSNGKMNIEKEIERQRKSEHFPSTNQYGKIHLTTKQEQQPQPPPPSSLDVESRKTSKINRC